MFAIGICRRALSIAIACVAISACGGRSNAAGGLAKKIGRYGTHCVPVTNAALEYHPVADGTEKTGSGLGAREPSCKGTVALAANRTILHRRGTRQSGVRIGQGDLSRSERIAYFGLCLRPEGAAPSQCNNAFSSTQSRWTSTKPVVLRAWFILSSAGHRILHVV